ncbi:MAG: methylmalonyl Co-A mutase-associated GTPase MeaB [Eubacteriales bacterium]|nr:methylmalonyl Co-A mutase-associated GTPase MeaB [Eubacteriales bacterium]
MDRATETKKNNGMDLATELKKGNKRAAARLISMIENQDRKAEEILKDCWSHRTKSRIIGITGPPGSGKSTLVDQLAKHLLKEKKKIGIIAVDPTSPITGGAFLGDRVRMAELNGEPDIFIRSMGTRGALGGISKSVSGAVRVLEVLGMDDIFIETVGIGQSEVDVAGIADIVVLVTVPGMGDDIQTEKAGILEVADVIVVNKADHDGVRQAVQHLKALIVQNAEKMSVEAPIGIVSTVASSGFGIPELITAMEAHYLQKADSGAADQIRRDRIKQELLAQIQLRFWKEFEEYDRRNSAVDQRLGAIVSADANPYSEAVELLKEFMEWRRTENNY